MTAKRTPISRRTWSAVWRRRSVGRSPITSCAATSARSSWRGWRRRSSCAHAAPGSAPHPGLAGRTFAAIERDGAVVAARRPRRRTRWRLAAVGATAAAAAAALALVVRAGSPAGELELQAALSSPAGVVRAAVDVRETGIGRVITFRSDSLPILPKGDYYELWFVGPGDRPGRPNRISAGTFHPDPNAGSHVRFAAAVDPALFPVLSVTAEPGDGDPRPTGPEVLTSAER